MSDNTTLNAGSGGDVISTEDLGGGVKITRVKIVTGGHATDGGDVTAANPVSVQLVTTASTGNESVYKNVAVTNTVATAKSGGGTLYGWHIGNPSANISYIKLFDSLSASISGGTVSNLTLMIPANEQVTSMDSHGWAFSTGLQIGATLGAADNNSTAPSSNLIVNLFYA